MDWCWSWNSGTLATWCEELTHLKRPWSWERLKVGREGDDRGWDGWMASLTGIWASSGSWWGTGMDGMCQSMGSQRVGHDWATELNWGNKFTSIINWILYAHSLPPPCSNLKSSLSTDILTYFQRKLKKHQVGANNQPLGEEKHKYQKLLYSFERFHRKRCPACPPSLGCRI